MTSGIRGQSSIHGYEPSEIIGQHFSVFYPDEDRKNKSLRLNSEQP